MWGPMEPVFAFICDYADAAGGKINALGIGFDTIYAQEVPTTHPHFYLVLKLRADAAEAGGKDIRINLIDADGNDVIEPVTGVQVIPRPKGSAETTANLVVGFSNVQFQKFGSHSLHVVIHGNTMARIPLRVAPSQGAK